MDRRGPASEAGSLRSGKLHTPRWAEALSRTRRGEWCLFGLGGLPARLSIPGGDPRAVASVHREYIGSPGCRVWPLLGGPSRVRGLRPSSGSRDPA